MSMASINVFPILILFVGPFVLGSALILVARRLRSKWARWTAGMGGVMSMLVFLSAVIWFAPYLWALHLEAKWHPADPKTKGELESFLSLYSEHGIQPSESDWGRNHPLQSGERMTQYRLLWSAPLDVVYTSNDTIVAIYTSYE